MVDSRLRVTLDGDALDDQARHLEHGGMLVRVDGPAPTPMSEVIVEIDGPAGRAEVPAQVVGVMPDGAVALALGDAEDARRRLSALRSGAPDEAGSGAAGAKAQAGDNIMLRLQRMTTVEKQDLAKHGDRMARMAIIRDTNKAIHPYVLQNTRLTSDEVRVIAGYRNINPEALARIAQSPEWLRDARIVAALVSNPKTPTQVAVKLIDRLPPGDLRRLSKAPDTPAAIQRAARRKLGG